MAVHPFANSLSVTRWFIEFVLIASALAALPLVSGTTDASDVQALQVLYTSVNSPSQLTGWTSSGGDPCGESWKGVTCEGSAVVAVEVSGLGLSGTMGYLLSDLLSLRKFDLSDNNFHDTIPYQLPPNLTSLNLARNNFTGNLPYSIANMVSLSYLNVSRNSLSQSIGDIFAHLVSLATLDLSLNNFTSDIPSSLSSLSNLSSLYMQNNQLTGSLNVLTGLPLTTLNVANNHFSGWIPRELSSIRTFIYDGNGFDNGPAPPPPPYIPPPPGRTTKNRSHSGSGTPPRGSDGQSHDSKKGLAVGALVGIILGSVVVALIVLLALAFCIRKNKREDRTPRASGGNVSARTNNVNTEMQEQRVKSTAAVTDIKPPPAEILVVDRLHSKNGSTKRIKSPITATPYTVASLQTATNSFSQEFLIGEGSLGRVYRAEFPNGKVMAIKKIDNAALSLQEEDNFLEAISNMSRLRHPNIVTLAGYCAEHGQRLLVYEYVGNGSLHDILHFAEDGSKTLTWNARVRVALGTARALEYLHEVCLPSVVHRNFKSANILLDEELNPHLSDCGLAALTPNTERQVSTQMVGSFGYSAPEFAYSGVYTVKSDVYSFGVVMLELLTGRKPLDSSRSRSEQSLVRWATPQLHDIDALSKMVDPALNGMYPAKSLSRFADIIALCVQPEPEFRPPMSEVVQALVLTNLVSDSRPPIMKQLTCRFKYGPTSAQPLDPTTSSSACSNPTLLHYRSGSSTPWSRPSSPTSSPGICLTQFSTSEAPPRASTRKVAERAWYSKKRAKWFVGVIGLLVLFFLMNCVMLLRLQDHGIRSESGFSGNSSVSSVSVTIREKWRKIGKGKKAQKGNYGRMLALASHALAEGQNKPEPKDLWLEPLVPAVSWKPCSDQRSWEPNGSPLFMLFKYRKQHSSSLLIIKLVCNAVAVARLLNSTLAEHFINYLTPDIRIVKELPKELQSLDLEAIGSVVTDVDIPKEAKPSFYLKRIIPILLKNRIVHFLGYHFNCGLRCRCNFHALQFVPKIQEVGALLLQRLRLNKSHPGQLDHFFVGSYAEPVKKQNKSRAKKASRYLALHLRFEIDMVAHSLCEFGGGDEERKELEAYREIHFPALTLLKKTKTSSTNACCSWFQPEHTMIALTSLYPELVTKENLLTPTELEPYMNFSSQLAALDFIGCTAADAFAMTDSGSQLSSLVSGFRIYYGGGKMPTIRPNKRRLSSIFMNNSTIEWRVFEQRIRKAVRQTKHIQPRPKARSMYRYPRCDECMCNMTISS
ncbi:unnamed protein product [Malus baccata var. baccata]